jgi:hypothetical protein
VKSVMISCLYDMTPVIHRLKLYLYRYYVEHCSLSGVYFIYTVFWRLSISIIRCTELSNRTVLVMQWQCDHITMWHSRGVCTLETICSYNIHCLSLWHIIRWRGHIGFLMDGKMEEGDQKEVLGAFLPQEI